MKTNSIFNVIIAVVVIFVCSLSASARNLNQQLNNVCVFVLSENGTYVKTPVYNVHDIASSVSVGSIANVCWQVSGYSSDEIGVHVNENGDGIVAYNIFNKQIICIYFNNKCKNFKNYMNYTKLPQSVVNECTNGIERSMDHSESLMFDVILTNAIKNHSITQFNMAKALHTSMGDNCIIDKARGIRYIFTDGVLTSYRSYGCNSVKHTNYNEISKKYNTTSPTEAFAVDLQKYTYEIEEHIKTLLP